MERMNVRKHRGKRERVQKRGRQEKDEQALNEQEEFMNIPSLDPQTLEGAIGAAVV